MKKIQTMLMTVLFVLCLFMGFMPATVSAAQPTVTPGDVYRTTRIEAVVEFTSDTAGEYYYIAILPDEYSQDLKINTAGEGIPCNEGEKVSVTVGGLTTDSYLFFLVVKSEDGTESEVMSAQIPEWDWWTLDEEGILHLETDKGLDNWKNWLGEQDLLYQMWYKESVVGVNIWKEVTAEIDGRDFPASEYPNLAAYTVEDGSEDYCAEDGVLYNAGKVWIEAYPGGKNDTAFAVPNSVNSIGSYAFYGNTKLKNITANEVGIVSSAFAGSAIETFSANAVRRIGDYAFNSCKKLTTVAVSSGKSFYIDMNAFADCISLTAFPFEKIDLTGHSVFKGCTSLTKIQVPKIIGNNMFAGCTSLTEITIPSTVIAVGASAFEGCTGLTSVIFESEVPPKILSNAFTPVAPNFRFHVPEGSENAYIEVLGEEMAPYILPGDIQLYALYVNGERIRSDKLEILCGDGNAVFDPDTNTLTLTDAAITEYGGKYGYGGAINSGLENFTIVLIGNNTINTEGDSINTGKGCNLVIKGEGTLTTNNVLDLGREPGLLYDGNNDSGDLTIDGATVTVGKSLFVHHNLIFTNGAQVNVTGKMTANHQSTLTVDGEATTVAADGLSMGNGSQSDQTESKLVVNNGRLTIRGGVAIPYPEDGDTAEYAVRFNPKEEGKIEINGGTFITEADCKVTNALDDTIYVAETLSIQRGSWENGRLVINAHSLTFVSEKPAACTAYGTKAYCTCSHCDKTFEDETCVNEITDVDTWKVIPPLGHRPVSDGDCTTDDKCSVCGKIVVQGKASHTLGGWISNGNSTHTRKCTVSGCTAGSETAVCHGGTATCTAKAVCSVCAGRYGGYTAHVFKWVIDKDATATEKGLKHEECQTCGCKKAPVEIPATVPAQENAAKKPGKVKGLKVKAGKKKVKVTFKKVKNAKKYIVRYSTKKTMKKAKTVITNKRKLTIRKLASRKKIYIQVQGINGTVKGKWSAKKASIVK